MAAPSVDRLGAADARLAARDHAPPGEQQVQVPSPQPGTDSFEPPPSDETIRARWLDVRQGLRTLTPLERTALIVTAVEGWSYAEAAHALGTTEGALRAAVSRARDKLEVA